MIPVNTDTIVNVAKSTAEHTYGFGVARLESGKKLEDAVRELIARRTGVKDLINLAAPAGDPSLADAETWVTNVDRIQPKVNQLEEEYASWSKCFQDYSRSCFSTYNFNTKVETLLGEVDALLADGKTKFDVADWSLVEAAKKLVPPATTVTMGVEPKLAPVRRFLDDAGAGILCIHGVGGVGKSTILQRVNNDLYNAVRDKNTASEEHEFNLVVWLEDGGQVETQQDGINDRAAEMQKSILRRLSLFSWENTAFETRKRIINHLLSSRSFVVLVDNLQEDTILEAVGIPIPIPGQNGPTINGPAAATDANVNGRKYKLLFTTRVPRLRCDMRIHVDGLDEEHARSLFVHKVRNDVFKSNDARICRYAEEVFQMCHNIPLLLINIGYAMSKNTSHVHWEHSSRMLRKSAFKEIKDMPEESKFYEILKINYDRLDVTHREPFLCCSLWPEGESIKKDELIEHWMGLDLIDENKFPDVRDAYRHGHIVIEHLRGAGLLESGNNEFDEVKMQQVIRGLALWTAREKGVKENKWLVPEGGEDTPLWIEAERVSLIHSDIVDELPQQIGQCPNLTVLMLQRSKLQSIPDDVLSCMPALTYLDMSHTDTKTLPQDIGKLLKLQYLNLSHTKLTFLPKDMRNLEKLKYLKLGGTSALHTIPDEVISNLGNLRVLDIYKSNFAEWQVGEVADGDNVEGNTSNAVNFKMFEGLKQIKALGITVKTEAAVKKLPELLHLPMWGICITQLEGVAVLTLPATFLGRKIKMRSNMMNLHKLSVVDCGDLEELIMMGMLGTTNCGLPYLEVLHLMHLAKLQKITWLHARPKDCFSDLTILRIEGCHGLKDISWVQQLPLLEEMRLSSCKALKEVIGKENSSDGGRVMNITPKRIFPNLKRMFLEKLPVVESICDDKCTISFLEVLDVQDCPNLERLPQLGNKMRRINVPGGFGYASESTNPMQKANLWNRRVPVENSVHHSAVPAVMASTSRLPSLALNGSPPPTPSRRPGKEIIEDSSTPLNLPRPHQNTALKIR